MTTAVGTKRFSKVATKFQVGAATLAVVAAATITPTIAHATPSIAPISQGLGGSLSSVILDEVVTPVTPVTHKAAPAVAGAVTAAGPIQNFFTGIVQLVAGWFYSGLTFVSNTFAAIAHAVAVIFKVGPYSTGA